GMPAKQTQTSAMGMSVAAANPYATAVSPATPVTMTNSKTSNLTVTPMQATSGSSAIVVPKGTATAASSGAASTSNASNTSSTTTAADSDLAMATLLDSLGSSLGSALQVQMDRALLQK
ncbi:hypothetical protein, partial [Undibacterium sp. TS12]|uniref:hypothetical protein n=1 Tax=Undibacterium sp. TS12 TaxID=2908202 RepID=UPI001F4D00DA